MVYKPQKVSGINTQVAIPRHTNAVYLDPMIDCDWFNIQSEHGYIVIGIMCNQSNAKSSSKANFGRFHTFV